MHAYEISHGMLRTYPGWVTYADRIISYHDFVFGNQLSIHLNSLSGYFSIVDNKICKAYNEINQHAL
jgi:hypothetical protein